MATITKTILPPDTYHSPDGVLEVTPKRSKHWYSEFIKAKGSNLRIPIGWDHSEKESDMLPLKKRDYDKKVAARQTNGHLSDVKLLNGGKDGIQLTMEVSDPIAADKLAKNEIFVSPVIWEKPFKDGRGTTYQDFIGCVDLVNYPVDQNQGPAKVVEPGLVACALRLGLDSKLYRLGYDDEENAGEVEKKATDEKSDEGDDKPENPDMPPRQGADEDKSKQRMEAIIAHLSELGAVMPADTDGSNFEERILTALMTLLKAKAAADSEEDDEDEEMPTVQDTTPAFAAMSLKVQELEKRDLENRKEKQASRRDKINLSLDTLLKDGKITPPEVEKLTKPVKAIKLSLDSSEDSLLAQAEMEIAIRDKLPRGSYWDPDTKLRMSNVEDTKKPAGSSFDNDNPTDEEAEELVDQVFKTRKPAKA